MLKRLISALLISGAATYLAVGVYAKFGATGLVLEQKHSSSAFLHEEFSLARIMSESVAEGYRTHMSVDGRQVLGVEAGPLGSPINQVAVVYHNHRENMLQRIPLGDELRKLGFHVYLAEYPNHRATQSSEAHEREVMDQIRLQLDYLNNRYDGYPVTLVGETIGAALGAQALVTYGVQLHHVVLVSPWTSIRDIAAEKATAYPLKHFTSYDYEVLPYLKAYQGHVTLIGTGNEPSVPETHVDKINAELFGGRHEAIWWTENGNASDWIHHFTHRQKQAMFVRFNHLVPLEPVEEQQQNSKPVIGQMEEVPTELLEPQGAE